MPSDKNRRSKKILSYEAIYLERSDKFDVEKFVDNRLAIEMLHEEKDKAHTHSYNVEKLLNESIRNSVNLELQVKEMSVKLEGYIIANRKLEEENRDINISLRKAFNEKQEMQVKLVRSEEILENVSRNSFIQFFVSLIAAVLLGFGVNIITTTPNDWVGWVLIVTSIVLSVVAFTFIRKRK